MDAEHQEDLENHFSHHRLAEVQSAIHHHRAELDENHDEERPGNLVFWQRGRDISSSLMFLRARENKHQHRDTQQHVKKKNPGLVILSMNFIWNSYRIPA